MRCFPKESRKMKSTYLSTLRILACTMLVASAVFILQMASTLTTTSGRQVILANGAQAKNIFWLVGSSATLGTTSVMEGNILALASITLQTGAALEGRALARTGAVTLDSNLVMIPAP